jgi:hypothetical protein
MDEPSASGASKEDSPRCNYLGCSRPATHGIERAYSSTLLYCLEHMESIASSKSSARTLRRVFSLADKPTSRLPSPRGDHYR